MTTKENFMNWDNLGTALITGASAGIGSEFARQLAIQGFDLFLIARREEKLKALKEDLLKVSSVNVDYIIADLSKLNENQKIVSKI